MKHDTISSSNQISYFENLENHKESDLLLLLKSKGMDWQDDISASALSDVWLKFQDNDADVIAEEKVSEGFVSTATLSRNAADIEECSVVIASTSNAGTINASTVRKSVIPIFQVLVFDLMINLRLLVQRPDPGLLLSPGSEDYLIPTPHSSYSLNTELMSSPSRTSNDQFLEMEDRGSTPSTKPTTVSETNFMTPDTPTEPQWTPNRTPMKRQGPYTEVPTDDLETEIINPKGKKIQPLNGMVATGNASKQMNRMSSIKSLDDLPMAPVFGENENHLKNPSSSANQKSNLSLDPSALVQHMGGNPGDNRTPNRYISVAGDVDVNCNTGNSNSSLSSRRGLLNQNQVSGPFDGYAGVNPVA
ncbi:hypothetical protein AVEN_83079-1 [Araneus ventricosus]|uniref:Uncharacterized protein n=1 Tax=Araneus ventricosus TaxID=182803 RepID=A0A4Y2ANA6_ARAVE|nr:hypothetical protein AVEN_83079-1 [Araneus ventricosus]